MEIVIDEFGEDVLEMDEDEFNEMIDQHFGLEDVDD